MATGIIIAAIVIAIIGLAVWALYGYTNTFYTEKQLTLTVTKTWVDPEPKRTYYLIAGMDEAGQDRVVELRETIGTSNTNIDIQFGKIEIGKTYHVTCIGEENYSIYYYYQCTFPST